MSIEVVPRSASIPLGVIHQGDCIELMQKMNDGWADLVFADPPFNIGYEYDEYHDAKEDNTYQEWCVSWMREVYRALKPHGTFWLAIGDDYAAELAVAAKKIGFTRRSWVVWYYTFGVNCTRKFSRSHTHLLHFVKDKSNFCFNAEDPIVRVPSARALVYADKRANPNGRLPDDTWILRPQDLNDSENAFQPMDDTWYFARVAGTFTERKGFHNCQMPEQLLARIIRVSSNIGDVVLDPFSGSGTTLAVAKKLGRQWIGCELSQAYVDAASRRLASVTAGSALEGPPDAIASAPTTANGKRLKTAPFTDPPNGGQFLASKTSASHGGPAACVSTGEVIPNDRSQKSALRQMVQEAIVEAFYSTHDGYSIDWLLANPHLQASYHEACRHAGLIGDPVDWNRELLRLRKGGSFPKRGDSKRIHVSSEEMDAYGFAAEIAWRLASEKFAGASLDEIYCDPARAQYFDRTAQRFAPGFAPEKYRWAALHLRKACKELVSDVKKYQFVFSTREFGKTLNWQRCDFDRYLGQPAIYSLLSDRKCHLFVDRTDDLGERLKKHSRCSSFQKSVRFLTLIPHDDLPNTEYQDGLKVDLVRRFGPKLNVTLAGLSETLAT